MLSKTSRNELARTVLEARKLAETAAGKALHTLGVDESDVPGHLDNDGRRLRIRLRAQARQLGDQVDAEKRGAYEIRHLAEKIAYDHWHRLLFARFLAENDLLISPEHGVGVSLSDCDELAPALGMREGWEVAASFAARMLPQIFRADDPAGNVLFAPEDRVALRKLVTDLPRDTFLADDSLGWVYQFWQSQRKGEVNKSGDKIGADEIAPVTQLFTEDYMVLFLLHNTLGAWWWGRCAARQGTGFRGQECKTEDDCRRLVALPGVNWEYLRFIKDEKTGVWRPAAGVFDGWPKTAKELRLLDPSMGSGHFVAAELPILVAMRVEEEGLSMPDAVGAVLRDNLFGLEIDLRCTQIAAFNLALASWKLIGQYRRLPSLNLACCGLGINARKEDWLKLAGDDTRLQGGMEQLYDLFQKAPDLGGLINPRRIGDLLVAKFHELQPLLEKALAREETKRDESLSEMGVTARGLVHAADILTGQFTLVATNVPYLGRSRQNSILYSYSERYHPEAKADLATVFIERCVQFVAEGWGSVGLVTPLNWLFQSATKDMRQHMLRMLTWNFAAGLGAGAFDTITGEVVTILLIGLTRRAPCDKDAMFTVNVSSEMGATQKAASLVIEPLSLTTQQRQLSNPDARFTWVERNNDLPLLNQFADSYQGLRTGDIERFCHSLWELDDFVAWVPLKRSAAAKSPFDGIQSILLWENGHGQLHENAQAIRDNLHDMHESGNKAWDARGVALNQINLKPTLYSGEKFDFTICVIIPKKTEWLPAIWAFCSSPDYEQQLRVLDPRLAITNQTLLKVPFDLAHWQKVAAEIYPHGLPHPHSDDPTQWLFNGHPKGSTAPLQVAVARLLGYRWPRQTGSTFPDSPALQADGLEKYVDADGIVCLNAIKGEQPAAERLRALLAAAFGRDWNAAKQADLLAQAEYAGKTLEEWLRNGFFEQHCQIFHQRPFIWQVWDGLRDGFSVLVNYQRLDRPMLEKLTYTYLGDWIARQKAAVAAGEEGSDAKLAAAQELKDALEKILEGEQPCDIFVRWKPLEKQPIGWDPDLNDGVRINIRPFMIVNDMGKKGAGLLRFKPNIKWEKDRGTDVASAPWFKVFKGERINDHHLTLAEKKRAREAQPLGLQSHSRDGHQGSSFKHNN